MQVDATEPRGNRPGTVTVAVGCAWGLSAALSGAVRTYFNDWREYRFIRDSLEQLPAQSSYSLPGWVLAFQELAGALLLFLTAVWLLLGLLYGLDGRRNRARYCYLVLLIALIVCLIVDLAARVLVPSHDPFGEPLTPSVAVDLALVLIGLCAIGLNAWSGRQPGRCLPTQR